MKRLRTMTVATAGALALVLGACGSDEENETEETPTVEESDGADESEGTDDAGDTEDASVAPAPVDGGDESADAGAGTVEDGVPPLEEVFPTAVENARGADSATGRMSGPFDSSGGGTIEVSGQLDDSNFSVAMDTAEGTAEVLAVDGDYYINGDEDFWASSGATGDEAAPLFDTWVQAPPELGVEQEFSFSELWQQMLQDIPTEASYLQTESATQDTFEGEEALRYDLAAEDTQIWLSADAQHLLGVSTVQPEGALEIVFSEWNEVEPKEAPADARPLEELVPGLMGGAGSGGAGDDGSGSGDSGDSGDSGR